MTDKPDPRLHAYRNDLADSRLRDDVQAESYSDGFLAQCKSTKTGLRKNPNYESHLQSEILLGEWVRIFELDEKWCWLQSLEDGYVGYAPAKDFVESYPKNSNKLVVIAAQGFLFSAPDIKSTPVMSIFAGSQLTFLNREDIFCEVKVPGHKKTCYALDVQTSTFPLRKSPVADLAKILYGFLDTPYLWGGRSRAGIDCSGLVQQCLFLLGFSLPLRDSDMQENSLGSAIPHGEGERSLQLGDLVFWPGHVGIMLDDKLLIHANATDMCVSIGPLSYWEEHIFNTQAKSIRSIRRLFS